MYMYMMAYAVHLLANTVHRVGLLIYMIGYAIHPSGDPDVLYMAVSTVHLNANAVYPSEAPDVHDSLGSTLNGKSSAPSNKYSTLKRGS